MDSRSRRGPARGGFTLIELLIVIAIISLLAAILFPAFAAVRGQARRTSCGNNLLQIGLGISQYIQDNDSVFPGAASFDYTGPVQMVGGLTSEIQPYIKNTQLLHCPEDPVQDSSGDPTFANYDYTDYAYNYWLGHNPDINGGANICSSVNACTQVGNAETAILNPALTVAATDYYPSQADAYTTWPRMGNTVDPTTNTWSYVDQNATPNVKHYELIDERHLGGAMYLMADGHVKWYRPEAVGVGWFGQGISDNRDIASPAETVGGFGPTDSNNLQNFQVTFSPD